MECGQRDRKYNSSIRGKMALSSTSVKDLINGLATLQIFDSGSSLIENVVYTFSSASLVFSTQGEYTITADEYIQFAQITNAFSINIQTVFNPSLAITSPFNVLQVTDTNDGAGALNFLFSNGSTPTYDINATYPAGGVLTHKRGNDCILTYQEFNYYLLNSIHYKNEIITFFNL